MQIGLVLDNQFYAQCWTLQCSVGLTFPLVVKPAGLLEHCALSTKQLFCVGLRNVIALHILKQVWVSGDQIIAYRQHQTSFCSIISSQTLLPTSSLNRPRSQRSWLSHLSILNVPAWAGGRFALNSTTVISLCLWLKAIERFLPLYCRCYLCSQETWRMLFLIIKHQHSCHILVPFHWLLIPEASLVLGLRIPCCACDSVLAQLL